MIIPLLLYLSFFHHFLGVPFDPAFGVPLLAAFGVGVPLLAGALGVAVLVEAFVCFECNARTSC
jgi:hypothetical protein